MSTGGLKYLLLACLSSAGFFPLLYHYMNLFKGPAFRTIDVQLFYLFRLAPLKVVPSITISSLFLLLLYLMRRKRRLVFFVNRKGAQEAHSDTSRSYLIQRWRRRCHSGAYMGAVRGRKPKVERFEYYLRATMWLGLWRRIERQRNEDSYGRLIWSAHPTWLLLNLLFGFYWSHKKRCPLFTFHFSLPLSNLTARFTFIHAREYEEQKKQKSRKKRKQKSKRREEDFLCTQEKRKSLSSQLLPSFVAASSQDGDKENAEGRRGVSGVKKLENISKNASKVPSMNTSSRKYGWSPTAKPWSHFEKIQTRTKILSCE